MRWSAQAKARPVLALASSREDSIPRWRNAVAAALAERQRAGRSTTVTQIDVVPHDETGCVAWVYFQGGNEDENFAAVWLEFDRPSQHFDHNRIAELLLE